MKRQAEDMVEQVMGVREVMNQIRVQREGEGVVLGPGLDRALERREARSPRAPAGRVGSPNPAPRGHKTRARRARATRT